MWYQKRSAWAVFIAAACLFALIAYNVVHAGPLVDLDARVASWLHAHGTPTLTQVMLFVSHAHDPVFIDAYSFVVAIMLARQREWSWIVGLAAAAPGGLLLNGLIKRLLERARPSFDDPLLTLTTYSFPSGHTAGAMLFYGTLSAYLLSRTHSSRVRNASLALWFSMVIIVGFSRMYLGVHYLSDVLGGAAWSLAWLTLCLIGVRTLQQRAQLPTG
ncbi:MAG: phosphatase PAP2 family protein [Burkholderiales bacterium]